MLEKLCGLYRLDRKRTLTVMAVTVLAIFLGGGYLVYKNTHLRTLPIDLNEWASEEMSYNMDTGWAIYDADEGNEADDGDTQGFHTCLTSPLMTLDRGSYTLAVDYRADKYQKVVFDDASMFRLSGNKHSCLYRFTMGYKGDFTVSFLYSGRGGFEVTGVTIAENTRNARIWLLWCVIFAIALNVAVIFRDKLSENREILTWLTVIALAASLPVFMKGIDSGHDIAFHRMRMESIAADLMNGQFPVRMNSIINDDYGYPVSTFYGDALLYIPALLRIIGFSVDAAYKSYILLVNFMTVGMAYACFSRMLSKRAALMSSAAYMLASYRLVDIFIRAAVGEYTSFIFFPVIVLALWEIYHADTGLMETGDAVTLSSGTLLFGTPSSSDGKGLLHILSRVNHRAAVTLALAMTGLCYTHVLSLEMAAVSIAIVAIINTRQSFRPAVLMTYIEAVIITLLLSAAFLVPFVDYYLNCDTAIKAVSNTALEIGYRGVYISQFFSFFTPYRGNGKDSTVSQSMQLTPGLVLMGAFMAAVYVLLNDKSGRNYKDKASMARRRLIRLTVYPMVFLFLASNLFPWDWWTHSNPLGQFMSQVQFPMRWIAAAVVSLSVLLGYTYDYVFDGNTAPERSLSAVKGGRCVTGSKCRDIMSGNNLQKEDPLGDSRYEGVKVFRIAMAACFIMSIHFLSDYNNGCENIKYTDTMELRTYTSAYEEYKFNAAEYTLVDVDYSYLPELVEVAEGTHTGLIVREKGVNKDAYVEAKAGDRVKFPVFNYPNYVVTDESGNAYEISEATNRCVGVIMDKDYTGMLYLRYKEPWYWRLAEAVSLITGIGLATAVYARRPKPYFIKKRDK